MYSNFHTHTTFCDGANSPEEVVKSAIALGLSAIGFSGHGYTPFDLRYCMKETDEYIKEINALKEKYLGDIAIFCGIEEDIYAPTFRDRFDYIIGSSHYMKDSGKYLPIDSGEGYFKACLRAFDENPLALARSYYENFLSYIKIRRPDIIGHFDLITKYDECGESIFLGDNAYLELSERYIDLACSCNVIFEVNTGAIARGLRKGVYPHENLLYVLKKNDAKLILSSDSHASDTLIYAFDETKALLREIGFESVFTLTNDGFKKKSL